MSEAQEKKTGDLTITIDRLICVGFGDCIEASPEAFEFDDEGIAVFCDSVDSVSKEELIAACQTCPVDAFTVLDSQGIQILP